MATKKIKIDNPALKFRKQSQKREPKVVRCSVLIVCEGTKTEPHYFEAFARKQQGVIVYDIEVIAIGEQNGIGVAWSNVIHGYTVCSSESLYNRLSACETIIGKG